MLNTTIKRYCNIDELKLLFNGKKVIIFDLDGTIANTETLHWMAYNKLLKFYDVELKNSDITRYIGHSEEYICQNIKKDYNIDFDFSTFLKERISIYLKLVEETNLQPYPFIDDILNKYHGQCTFILVTSQIPPVVNKLIKYWGYEEYFPESHRYCCHDNTYNKADIYRNINKHINSDSNVNTSQVLLLEDSEHYMKEAKNLGFNVIGVEHRYNENKLMSCDAILCLN